MNILLFVGSKFSDFDFFFYFAKISTHK